MSYSKKELAKISLELNESIKSHKKIVILHHVAPDPDCCGSQFGLKNLILLNFPNKEVYCLGSVNYLNNVEVLKFDDISHFTDQDYKDSLVIIPDNHQWTRTNWKGFIDKNRIQDYIVIDHHIVDEGDADVQLRNAKFSEIDPKASSTCEQLALIMFHLNWKYNALVLNFFTWGILSDTGQFTFSCRPKTFEVIQKFLQFEGYSYEKILTASRVTPENFVRLNGYVMSNFIIENNIGYYVLEKDILAKYNANFEVGASVNVMGSTKSVNQWVLFTAGAPDNKYRTEIRSSKYDVEVIAKQFGGGGHALASGAYITADKIQPLIQAMKENLDKREIKD